MTSTEAYAKAQRMWMRASSDLEIATKNELEARIAMQVAWTTVKETVPPGAYSVEHGHIIIVGQGDYPQPLTVYSEREMHPCGRCARARGACRCEKEQQT